MPWPTRSRHAPDQLKDTAATGNGRTKHAVSRIDGSRRARRYLDGIRSTAVTVSEGIDDVMARPGPGQPVWPNRSGRTPLFALKVAIQQALMNLLQSTLDVGPAKFAAILFKKMDIASDIQAVIGDRRG